jgi:hypothetical protein
MKNLCFLARGDYYLVDEHGCIIRTDMPFEPGCKSGHQWDFIGVSTHHMHRHPTISFQDIWDNPKLALGGYVWDIDHGTVRSWRGGGSHRIMDCYMRDN